MSDWREHVPDDDRPDHPDREVERKPHREFCAICGRVSRVSFFVPDAVWALAVHASRLHDIHCLACFTEQADERSVEWCGEIEFFPMSERRHRREFVGALTPELRRFASKGGAK